MNDFLIEMDMRNCYTVTRKHTDVVIGKSRIQGKGVFAARCFRKGEVILQIKEGIGT